MVPEDVHGLTPGKRDSADVMKLRTLRRELSLHYLDGPSGITRVLLRGKPDNQSQRSGGCGEGAIDRGQWVASE